MSEQPPPEYPLNYITTSPYGNAPTLVRLAGIFNLIMGGINMIGALCYVGMAIFMHFVFSGRFASVMGIPATTMSATGSATMPRMAGMPPEWVMVGI
jgi:hypothetical protein